MAGRLTRLAGPGLALVVAGAAAAAGCSGTTATSATTSSTSVTATAPAIAAATTPPQTHRPDESEGAFVFRTECAGCHGTHGEGNLGPELVGIADRMTEIEQLALVRSGRGRMPPFAPGLSDEEIAAVVAYTRTELH